VVSRTAECTFAPHGRRRRRRRRRSRFRRRRRRRSNRCRFRRRRRRRYRRAAVIFHCRRSRRRRFCVIERRPHLTTLAKLLSLRYISRCYYQLSRRNTRFP